jgi:prepilin-type N-terminal cleavage/methylation domain-containing protein
MNIFNNKRGFTLIELLVVIAIISLLASIILASIQSARNKAKISKYVQGLTQFSTLMELEYAHSGSYAQLATPGWLDSVQGCESTYGPASGRTSKVLANANSVCKSIISASSGYPYILYITYNNNKYSVGGWYQDTVLYCIGSSGKSFAKPWTGIDVYNNVGCANNL